MRQILFAFVTAALVLFPLSASAQGELTVSQEPTAPYVIAGGTVTYVIEVNNTGTEAVAGASIRATMSGSLSALKIAPLAETITNSSGQTVVIFEPVTLAVGESFEATIDARVDTDLSAGTVLTTTVETELSEVVVITPPPSRFALPGENGAGGTGEGEVAGARETLPRTGLGLWLLLLPVLAMARNTWRKQLN